MAIAPTVKLADRVFRSTPKTGLIETRSEMPSAPLYVRFYEVKDSPIEDGTFYELWRGFYKGYLVMSFFVPLRMTQQPRMLERRKAHGLNWTFRKEPLKPGLIFCRRDDKC